MSADGAGWESQRERSSAFWVGLLAWVVLRLGRTPARLLLWPTVAWFLIAAGDARRASRQYLRRVLDREPTVVDLARHFFTFAACSLDRLLLAGDNDRRVTLNVDRSDAVMALFERRQPALLLVAHFGSFEALRVVGSERHAMPLKILLDRRHGPIVTRLIERIDPDFANSVIDASERGPTLVLALRDAVRAGFSLGVMADRVRGGEPAASVAFLGGEARLPTSPWVLASALKLPVIAAFGVYRDGRRYDTRFELLEASVDLPRAGRDAALQACAQRYADLLERQVRAAPHNWFNFYDYWVANGIARPERAAHVPESRFGVWFLGTETWTRHVLDRALDDLERLIPARRDRYPVVVDVGCGWGHSFARLNARFSPERLIGVDVSPEMLAASAATAARAGLAVELLLGDDRRLPLADQSVDLLLCHQTFHHLVHQHEALAEFRRVLKPGGLLLFSESTRRYIHSWIIRLLFRHPMDVQRTAPEYLAMIGDSGFDVAPTAVSYPYLWWSRPDLGALERVFGIRPAADRDETLINVAALRR